MRNLKLNNRNTELRMTSSSYSKFSKSRCARDTFSTTIKITDANDNVLGITTFTRNNDADTIQIHLHIQIR